MELLPCLLAVQMNPEVNRHVASLLKVYEQLVFHFDTTFDIGTFFTSILSLRHPVFKNEPILTVAVMYHETTNENAHNEFFQAVLEKLDLNKSGVIIVTDREKSITNAIKTYLNDAKNAFCWNHIRKVSFLSNQLCSVFRRKNSTNLIYCRMLLSGSRKKLSYLCDSSTIRKYWSFYIPCLMKII